MRDYYVYIMTNRTHTLYIGVTNGLFRRVEEHRADAFGGFTSKYKIHRLIFYEHYNDIGLAIAREKQLKNWRREKKITLIERMNPRWSDLSREMFGEISDRGSERVDASTHDETSKEGVEFASLRGGPSTRQPRSG